MVILNYFLHEIIELNFWICIVIDFTWTIELQIVEHFKEFPLAITVVGRSLCGKSAESWLKRASELKGASILNSEAALIDDLQSSLDALNEEGPYLKECFLDLGSFPEDQRIPAAALIDMWAE